MCFLSSAGSFASGELSMACALACKELEISPTRIKSTLHVLTRVGERPLPLRPAGDRFVLFLCKCCRMAEGQDDVPFWECRWEQVSGKVRGRRSQGSSKSKARSLGESHAARSGAYETLEAALQRRRACTSITYIETAQRLCFPSHRYHFTLAAHEPELHYSFPCKDTVPSLCAAYARVSHGSAHAYLPSENLFSIFFQISASRTAVSSPATNCSEHSEPLTSSRGRSNLPSRSNG